MRKALLAAGPLSSLLYIVATDGVAASMWAGYRRAEQMVSDLFAVGSPSRDFLVQVMWPYTLLLIAFGLGVWISAGSSRALRIGGGLLIGYGVSNVVGLFYPLTLNEAASVPMHVVVTNLQLLLMVGAMCFIAAGCRGWMRIYSIVSLIATIAMGILAFTSAPGPSLLLGIGERLSIGAFLLWVGVLAIALWATAQQTADRPKDNRSARDGEHP